jgi:hypothetical protein
MPERDRGSVAVLETHQSEAVRALGRLLDEKVQAVVAEATNKRQESGRQLLLCAIRYDRR